jgi:metallo-beta-lactamase class B
MRSSSLLLLLGVLWFAGGCAGPTVRQAALPEQRAGAAGTVQLGEDLSVRPLGHGLWRHVSTAEVPGFGLVPSNGLVVVGSQGALLIDTPWTRPQTRRLLAWVHHALGVEVKEAIVTHSHADRIGGIDELAGVRVHALPATTALAARHGHPFQAVALPDEASLALVGLTVETFFPGAGHTGDNLVVWLPAWQLLFGGCFIKSAQAQGLGNVEDADVASWRSGVQRVIARYPEAVTVVPGHGEPGGPALLVHTGQLVDAALRPAGK